MNDKVEEAVKKETLDLITKTEENPSNISFEDGNDTPEKTTDHKTSYENYDQENNSFHSEINYEEACSHNVDENYKENEQGNISNIINLSTYSTSKFVI